MPLHLIETIPVGSFQCNCSLLMCPETKRAVLVDPGDDAETILALVRAHGAVVTHLLHTHAHLDHIGATRKVKEALGAVICLHRGDQWLYDNLRQQGAMFQWQYADPLPVDHYLEHESTIACGGETLGVLHTPGHTPGSVCFHAPRVDRLGAVLFSGDTLFQRGIGRTDLWGGDYEQIIQSITRRLMPLAADTLVIPGHGPATRIGEERAHNPFLNAGSP